MEAYFNFISEQFKSVNRHENYYTFFKAFRYYVSWQQLLVEFFYLTLVVACVSLLNKLYLQDPVIRPLFVEHLKPGVGSVCQHAVCQNVPIPQSDPWYLQKQEEKALVIFFVPPHHALWFARFKKKFLLAHYIFWSLRTTSICIEEQATFRAGMAQGRQNIDKHKF